MTRNSNSRYDDFEDYDHYRDYDDYDDGYYPQIKKKTGTHTLLWVLIGGGVGLFLLLCFLGVVYLAVMSLTSDAQPDEFVGSWKSRWTIGAVAFDSIYTFNKDGTFREQSFDLKGFQRNITDGHWRFRNGQIEINWNNGGFEHATVRRINARTLNYQVVNHTDRQQIGMTVTLRRQ